MLKQHDFLEQWCCSCISDWTDFKPAAIALKEVPGFNAVADVFPWANLIWNLLCTFNNSSQLWLYSSKINTSVTNLKPVACFNVMADLCASRKNLFSGWTLASHPTGLCIRGPAEDYAVHRVVRLTYAHTKSDSDQHWLSSSAVRQRRGWTSLSLVSFTQGEDDVMQVAASNSLCNYKK